MRKTLTLAACLLVAGIAGAQMKPKPTQPAPSAGGLTPRVDGSSTIQVSGAQVANAQVKLISIDDAYKLFKENKAVFVDVRSTEQFGYGHIKGSMNIPGSQIVARFREIPPGKAIITYCACSAEQSSSRAVQMLAQHGVQNAFALKGGWNQWKAKSLPSASGK